MLRQYASQTLRRVTVNGRLRALPIVPDPERIRVLRIVLTSSLLEEDKMPVIILWAVPAIVVVGGGIYLISHLH